jgi:hypothetical protein
MQKGGFCNVKVWFLHAKNHTFAAQKGGFLQSIVIQIVTQYCFSHILFPPLVLQFIVPHPRNSTKWRCNSHHFDTLKPFGLD